MQNEYVVRIAELQADIDFLARRAQRAGSFTTSEERDWGVSSNSLVSMAYGSGVLEMPSDWYDYAACERAALAMPSHRRTKLIDEALARQKAHVTVRYPEGKGHHPEAMRDFISR